MSKTELPSSQSPLSSLTSARLYEALVSTAITEDGSQRSISQNTKGIYHVHEIAFVYQYEKALHDILIRSGTHDFSSSRESTTENVKQSDLVLRGSEQNIIFEFKMDCRLSSVAHDAVKVGPAVKTGNVAYLINVKTMLTRDLSGFTKQRTYELNNDIKNLTSDPYYAINVVSEFDFISQAGNPTLADVLCMWEVHI